MRTLLLFRGAPGCGKSTYTKEHNLEQYVLSADTLRLMCQSAQETPAGQMEISPQNDDVVWKMLFKLIEVRMSHGEFTVIDATNSKTVEMNCYKNLAKQYRYRMYVIDMTDIPIEECKRRNAQREWLKRVPEAAIDKMYARFATQKVPSGVTVLPSTTDVLSDLNYSPNDFNQWKKIHIIGDIHGCYTCLSEYLGEMKDDELYIFVGDYLDVSRALLAQISRHRHISMSCRSQRYCSEDGFKYVNPFTGEDADVFDNMMSDIDTDYQILKKYHNAKNEDARAVLPNACCTEFYITMNARALIEMSHLRLCSRAQKEIREMFTEMKKEVAQVCPEVANWMVPSCEANPKYPFCPEGRGCCGRHPRLADVYKPIEKKQGGY